MLTAVLYGKSLLLAGIGASLERRAGVRVQAIDATQPSAAGRVSELHPDVVVFDLAAACPESAIALWKAQPYPLLIGIDPSADLTLVLSGQTTRVASADDLIDRIVAFASERRGRTKDHAADHQCSNETHGKGQS